MSKKNTPVSSAALTENQTKLVNLLKAGGGTAAQIAEHLECSGPTAYARIRALEEAGYKMTVEKVRAGSKGPPAKHFSLPSK
jgi:predicted ArsR family transcriptional regulator